MYDIAIIGSGPAGVSAAINAKLLNKKYIWVSSRAVSKKVGAAPHIKNYPGLPDVTGDQLGWALLNHTQSMGIELFEEIETYRRGRRISRQGRKLLCDMRRAYVPRQDNLRLQYRQAL